MDRERYLAELTLADAASEHSYKLKSALDRAHDIRKFEIDLYWRRANYFWLLQAGVFTGFGITESAASLALIPLTIAGLGILVSLGGYLSALGSKFWLKNWESHIDFLEDSIDGKLHKSQFQPGGRVSWSVSRVNEMLLLGFVAVWLIIAATQIIEIWPIQSVSDIFGIPFAAEKFSVIVIAAIYCTLAMAMLLQRTGRDLWQRNRKTEPELIIREPKGRIKPRKGLEERVMHN